MEGKRNDRRMWSKKIEWFLALKLSNTNDFRFLKVDGDY